MEEIEGVVNAEPVPKLEPPEETAYQFKVADPSEETAANETVPASQRLLEVEEDIVGIEFIVAFTAVLEEVHPLSVAET